MLPTFSPIYFHAYALQELLQQLSEDSRRRKVERLVTATAKATERSVKVMLTDS